MWLDVIPFCVTPICAPGTEGSREPRTPPFRDRSRLASLLLKLTIFLGHPIPADIVFPAVVRGYLKTPVLGVIEQPSAAQTTEEPLASGTESVIGVEQPTPAIAPQPNVPIVSSKCPSNFA